MSGAMIAGIVGDIANNIWGNINQSVSLGQQQQFMDQQRKLAQQQLDLAEKEYYSNIDIMNRNFGLQKEAFNYNKQQAELTRMREDNAFQRRVADTVKAGFSPLATEGVSSSSQSPTLTAPQLDPQGVNQATSNRLSAYNSAMQNNNTKRQLQLQEQQLKLAQIETITETIAAVQDLRSQNIINQRNQHELEWYEKHGYRNTNIGTIISDIINGVNFKGKSISSVASDSINSSLDKILNNKDVSFNHNFSKISQIQKIKKNISNNNALSNPNKGDFYLFTNNKKFASILNDIKKLSQWSTNTPLRREKIQKYLDSVNVNYDKNIFNKSVISNDEVKYLQDLLLNYRKSVLGN